MDLSSIMQRNSVKWLPGCFSNVLDGLKIFQDSLIFVLMIR